MTYAEIDELMARVAIVGRDTRQCQSRRIGLPGGVTGARCDRRTYPRHVYDFAAQRVLEKHRNVCTADEV